MKNRSLPKVLTIQGIIYDQRNKNQRGKRIMQDNYIKHPCIADPTLTDLFIIYKFGNEKFVFCATKGVWEED